MAPQRLYSKTKEHLLDAYYFSREMVLTLPINMYISQSSDYEAKLILHNVS